MRPRFPANSSSLPVEVYVSSVDALYKDKLSLFSGTISAVSAALFTGWVAGSPWVAACAAPLALTGLVRGLDMAAYARRRPRPATYKDARHWELRYIAGSCTFVIFLSLWCFLTFALSSNAAVHLVSFSVSLAYMIGITGRNFSSDQLVTFHTICAGLPMTAALLMRLELPYAFLAFLLVPFFLSIKSISTRLRNTLFDAVVASHHLRLLAAQFDTALNNMPHGLCMFDAERKFVVCNRRFMDLLDLKGESKWRGRDAVALLAHALKVKADPGADHAEVLAAFKQRMNAARRDVLVVEAFADKSLELTFQPISAGGCVVLIEDITDKRKAEARIEHLARYDALTGLPNRTHFQERFEDAVAGGRPHALLFIDLDQFKVVNDTLGHPCGDALLCLVAERLRRTLRASDLIARFGGDEFVVLHPLKRGVEEASVLARRIVGELSEAFSIQGHQIVIGTSIGIAVAPRDGTTFPQVLKSADMALYSAKSGGRGLWRFFEPEMDVKAQARRALELDIRNALNEDGFEVHFQPIISLRSGRTTVCEALVRWRHPERGMVPPDQFIPVAEEMGLILELGEWILRKSCAECLTWPQGVGVAVNISPIQFRRGDVARVVRAALADTGLPAHRLELEITESVLLENTAATRATLEELRAMGVRISLDDFGTGYASLSYLHHFPLNKIKIDRSFLRDVEVDERSLTLLQGVARLTADLGMSVVIEGVETQKQLALLLKQPSIGAAQGFLFSPALPPAAIRAHLDTGKVDLERVA